jgi:hypothetical protein
VSREEETQISLMITAVQKGIAQGLAACSLLQFGTTPALALGITDHIWGIAELIEIVTGLQSGKLTIIRSGVS